MLKTRWHYFAYAFGPVLFVAGVALAVRESAVVASLKETTAQITSSEFYDSSGRRTTSYSLNVKYTYNVDGKSYENNRIGVAEFSYEKQDSAREALKAYPTGKTVPVYYAPENPATSYLDKTGPGNGEIMIMLSIFVIIVATPIVWFVRRHSAKVPPREQ